MPTYATSFPVEAQRLLGALQTTHGSVKRQTGDRWLGSVSSGSVLRGHFIPAPAAGADPTVFPGSDLDIAPLTAESDQPANDLMGSQIGEACKNADVRIKNTNTHIECRQRLMMLFDGLFVGDPADLRGVQRAVVEGMTPEQWDMRRTVMLQQAAWAVPKMVRRHGLDRVEALRIHAWRGLLTMPPDHATMQGAYAEIPCPDHCRQMAETWLAAYSQLPVEKQ
jgi:hypothetical protein